MNTPNGPINRLSSWTKPSKIIPKALRNQFCSSIPIGAHIFFELLQQPNWLCQNPGVFMSLQNLSQRHNISSATTEAVGSGACGYLCAPRVGGCPWAEASGWSTGEAGSNEQSRVYDTQKVCRYDHWDEPKTRVFWICLVHIITHMISCVYYEMCIMIHTYEWKW